MEKHRTNLTWALVPEEPPEAMLAKMCEASLAMEVLLDDTRFACERALWEAAIAYVKEHLQVSAENVLTQALRYQHLRGVDLDKVYVGGVFVGLTPENIVLNGEELDQAVDAAIAGQRDAWLASWTRRDQEFDPARHADHTLAAIAANTAARKYAAANPPPPLVWHGRRLSYPAAVIEQAARELVECRIAPADSLYADAAE